MLVSSQGWNDVWGNRRFCAEPRQNSRSYAIIF